jgi:MoxR-like ATPase
MTDAAPQPRTRQEAARHAPRLTAVREKVSEYFVGHEDVVEHVLAALLARGHVLFEDHPGLGKTLLVKTVAKAVGAGFDRVQFTPDLLPSDILGARIWRPEDRTFEFQEGPIFTNLLLADEINRAPPKTQSALLEALEERQVTVEGTTHDLPSPFFVLATQNPIDQEGTYPLPEAQMDRFLMRLHTGYPETAGDEEEILRRRIDWKVDDPTDAIEPVLPWATFTALQEAVEDVFVHDDVLAYITTLVRRLRDRDRVDAGPSPRGALALLKVGRALALVRGRDFVVPDDVQSAARPALAHRVVLGVEGRLDGASAEALVDEVVDAVPAPSPKREA